MKRKILTDTELRAVWPMHREETYCVPEGTILTPSARDYIRENNINLQTVPDMGEYETMTVSEIPMKDGSPIFRDGATGRTVSEKTGGNDSFESRCACDEKSSENRFSWQTGFSPGRCDMRTDRGVSGVSGNG